MALRDRPRAENTTVSDDERLPVSDGVPMESEQDAMNARLYLCEPLKLWCLENGFKAFVGSNSFVYYKPPAVQVGPDFYVVNGGTQDGREMWVVWRESGLMPSLVVEFISASTEDVDRGRKMAIYQNEMRCLDYFMCERDIGVTEGYRLRNGVYVRTRPDRNRRLRCGSLPLLLGFQGEYLRFFTLDGTVLPTEGERERQRADAAVQRADAAGQRADAAVQRADAAERRAERALEELRALRARLDER